MCLPLLAGMACEALVDLEQDQFVGDRLELDKRTGVPACREPSTAASAARPSGKATTLDATGSPRPQISAALSDASSTTSSLISAEVSK
jgi:hypothetical protein